MLKNEEAAENILLFYSLLVAATQLRHSVIKKNKYSVFIGIFKHQDVDMYVDS